MNKRSKAIAKYKLVHQVAVASGIIHADVETVLNAILGAIRDSVREGGEIHLNGFGTFKSRVRPQKVARNLKGKLHGRRKNPEPIILPEKVVPHFKFSPKFLERHDDAIQS